MRCLAASFSAFSEPQRNLNIETSSESSLRRAKQELSGPTPSRLGAKVRGKTEETPIRFSEEVGPPFLGAFRFVSAEIATPHSRLNQRKHPADPSSHYRQPAIGHAR